MLGEDSADRARHTGMRFPLSSAVSSTGEEVGRRARYALQT